MSQYVTRAYQDIIKTVLNVAIDNEKITHHSLQLVLDENVSVDGENCSFSHHGRIGVGHAGSGKVDELRVFVKDRYPQILDGSRFLIGTLKNDHLWNLDEADMVKFMENLISYALIRDEYREYVKRNSGK